MGDQPKEHPEERKSPLELIKRLDYPSGKQTFWQRYETTILRVIIAGLLLAVGILLGRGLGTNRTEPASNYKIVIVNSGSGEPAQIIDSLAKVTEAENHP